MDGHEESPSKTDSIILRGRLVGRGKMLTLLTLFGLMLYFYSIFYTNLLRCFSNSDRSAFLGDAGRFLLKVKSGDWLFLIPANEFTLLRIPENLTNFHVSDCVILWLSIFGLLNLSVVFSGDSGLHSLEGGRLIYFLGEHMLLENLSTSVNVKGILV